jgi:hypothetical protein
MPLEDLEALGYQVSRPPAGMLPATGPTVWGHDRQWMVPEGEDEEEIVKQATNHAKILGKMDQAQQYFGDQYANWPTMTNAQKDTAMRNGMRVLSNICRHLRNDLESEGI